MNRDEIIKNFLGLFPGLTTAEPTKTGADPAVQAEIEKLESQQAAGKERASKLRASFKNGETLRQAIGINAASILYRANKCKDIYEKGEVAAAELRRLGLPVYSEEAAPVAAPVTQPAQPAPVAIAPVAPVTMPAGLGLTAECQWRKDHPQAEWVDDSEIEKLERLFANTKPGLTRDCIEARIKTLKAKKK